MVECFWKITSNDTNTSVNHNNIFLISVCVDGTIRIWNALNGQLIKVYFLIFFWTDK